MTVTELRVRLEQIERSGRGDHQVVTKELIRRVDKRRRSGFRTEERAAYVEYVSDVTLFMGQDDAVHKTVEITTSAREDDNDE